MFTEQQIRDWERRRNRFLIPVVVIALSATFAYLAITGFVREPLQAVVRQRWGIAAGEALIFLLILGSLVPFIASLIWAERRANRLALACPSCGAALRTPVQRLLGSRRCQTCEQQVVLGKSHSSAALERHRRVCDRRFLALWIWVWPLLGLGLQTWFQFDPRGFRDCPNSLWLPSLLGVVTAGWIVFRDRDRRFLPHLVVSVLVTIVGAILFFRN